MFTSIEFTRHGPPALSILPFPPGARLTADGERSPRTSRSPVSQETAKTIERGLFSTAGAGTGTACGPYQPSSTAGAAKLPVFGQVFAYPVVIVDEAMLQPADLQGATTGTLADGTWAQLRPPQPGGEGTYPSTALLIGERSVSAVVRADQRPTVIVEYVAVYRSDGARQYLQDLHGALAACRGDDGQGGHWTILAAGLAGRDSLRLRLREDFEYDGEAVTKDTYIAASRTGRVLVVVIDAGWETGDGHRELVEELITPAVRRAGILR